MVEDRDSPPPYQGESRSRPSISHLSHDRPSRCRCGGGQSEKVAQCSGFAGSNPLVSLAYNRCLSLTLDVLIERRQIGRNAAAPAGLARC
jgi:hypothetical protein